MNSHLTRFMPRGRTAPTLIDLTAEGFSAHDNTPGDLVLLGIVVGALLLLGVALLGLQIG